ncbi:MAG TPA: FHA domain-containing protein [Acidimicrobiales bacterium]|nr:FHA domain-containing protein [Acidimicrobiales bacterium]
MIPGPLLQILKYCLLALLWLFFLRVLRAVWAEVKRSRSEEPAVPAPAGAGAAPTRLTNPGGLPQRGPSPMASLRLSVVEPSEHRGQTYDLDDETTLGRDGECGVALPDDRFASHLHARVWHQDGQVWIEDLGSTNGTYLNRHRLSSRAVLNKGDQVQVGRTVFEVNP